MRRNNDLLLATEGNAPKLMHLQQSQISKFFRAATPGTPLKGEMGRGGRKGEGRGGEERDKMGLGRGRGREGEGA